MSVRPDSWKYFCSAFKSYHRKPIYRDFFTPSFLESANWIFAVFRKGEPQKMTYHLEIITGQDAIPPPELLESYNAFGWEYVSCMSGLYHIFSNAEENPVELHTDPIVQSLAYEKIEKKVNNGFSSCILLMLYILFVNGTTLRSGVFTLTEIIQQNLIPFFLADFLMILLFFFGRLLPFLQIKKQMKSLRNGSFPEVKIRKKRRLHSGYCHLGVFLCLVVMVFYTMTIGTYTSAEEAMKQQGHVPFVTLEEIEGLPPIYPFDYSDPSSLPNMEDYLYHPDHSMMAPEQFILRQDEASPVRDKENPAYLWMHYIEVSLPFLAEPLYQERIEELLPENAIPVDISADIDKLPISLTYTIDTENSVQTEYHSDRFDGYLLSYKTTNPLNLIHIWDENNFYKANGDVDEEELIKMIESLEVYFQN